MLSQKLPLTISWVLHALSPLPGPGMAPRDKVAQEEGKSQKLTIHAEESEF